jgi:hypothetical protein
MQKKRIQESKTKSPQPTSTNKTYTAAYDKSLKTKPPNQKTTAKTTTTNSTGDFRSTIKKERSDKELTYSK